MSTQRQVSHAEPLPKCQQGHCARHIIDARRASAGGGHFVECSCGSSRKHAEYVDALREWCRMHGHPMPVGTDQRPLPLATVTALRPALEARG